MLQLAVHKVNMWLLKMHCVSQRAMQTFMYLQASELVASSLESLTASRSSSNYEKTAGVFQQVPASEAVSITQGIAYKVQVPIDGIMRSCVFIDTPGHEVVYRTAYGHCMFRKTEENQLPWDIMLNGNEEDKLVVFRVYVKPRPSPPGRNHQYLVPSR
ncbi:uncharacterized protein [Rutidosis leptorrhynchoides]|uniref:uncharacterized protein isoform X2 n=1 Tax=Rutidosis leptorrhynchoides TaxID=125765 RepID=UPI003A997210